MGDRNITVWDGVEMGVTDGNGLGFREYFHAVEIARGWHGGIIGKSR